MRSRLPTLLVAAALLLLAVVAARGESAIPTGPGTIVRPDPAPAAAEGPVEGIESNALLDLIGGVSTGVLLLVVVAMLLIGLAGLLATLAGLGRRRGRGLALPDLERAEAPEVPGGTAVRALAEATRAARHELSRRAGGDPADAVVAAWVVLEDAAAGLGTPRAAHQTPTEFTAEVLAAHRADDAAMADLRALYHRARFRRSGAVTEADATAAADALDRVERSLTGVRRR